MGFFGRRQEHRRDAVRPQAGTAGPPGPPDGADARRTGPAAETAETAALRAAVRNGDLRAAERLGKLLAARGPAQESAADAAADTAARSASSAAEDELDRYRRRAAGGDREAAHRAATALLRSGRTDEAERLLDRAVQAGHPASAYLLAQLRRDRGEHARAVELMRLADRGGKDGAARLAALWLLEDGDASAAVPLLRKVISRGDRAMIPALVSALLAVGDLDAAEAAVRPAADAGDWRAQYDLLAVRQERARRTGGDLADQELWTLLKTAATGLLAEVTPLVNDGRLGDAEELLRGPAAAGDPVAMENLAIVMMRRAGGDPAIRAEARTHLERSAALGNITAEDCLTELDAIEAKLAAAEQGPGPRSKPSRRRGAARATEDPAETSAGAAGAPEDATPERAASERAISERAGAEREVAEPAGTAGGPEIPAPARRDAAPEPPAPAPRTVAPAPQTTAAPQASAPQDAASAPQVPASAPRAADPQVLAQASPASASEPRPTAPLDAASAPQSPAPGRQVDAAAPQPTGSAPRAADPQVPGQASPASASEPRPTGSVPQPAAPEAQAPAPPAPAPEAPAPQPAAPQAPVSAPQANTPHPAAPQPPAPAPQASAPQPPAPDAKPMTVAEALARVYAVLLTEAELPDGHRIGQEIELAPGIEVLTAFDGPGTMRLLSAPGMAALGDPGEVFRRAVENLMTVTVGEHHTLGAPGGAVFHRMAGTSPFTASTVLVLDRVVAAATGRPLPPDGALVGIPTRYELVFHPVRDAAARGALEAMAHHTAGRYAQGPAALAPAVYWWRDGALTPLTALENGTAVLTADPEFEAVLDRLPPSTAV
ncbi:hypothetical protein [Streptantibioticus silvisoli]|uniref:Tetratricopeptide repeat protein n=1 Tax=Streptantibioticus silvisoli TaxID=2705255 RepID=A0ABT6W248_9ACTN|nr:hypothetical protein [Streptantibioticus silvisoli]MDI5964369.1 hypothetical protein [Streptantibioticus silvisoli]